MDQTSWKLSKAIRPESELMSISSVVGGVPTGVEGDGLVRGVGLGPCGAASPEQAATSRTSAPAERFRRVFTSSTYHWTEELVPRSVGPKCPSIWHERSASENSRTPRLFGHRVLRLLGLRRELAATCRHVSHDVVLCPRESSRREQDGEQDGEYLQRPCGPVTYITCGR
jgi:hypothetical protein